MNAGIARSGLGLTGLSRKSKIWTPADIFSAGVIGFWFDFSDMSLLFQDAAGTVPVTAVGQTVALVKDKSGNDYSCTASGSQCPTYAGSTGLQFDGSDDGMATSSADFYGTNGATTVFAEFTPSSTLTGATIYSILDDDNGSQRTAQLLRLAATQPSTIWFTNNGASYTQQQLPYASSSIHKLGVCYSPGVSSTLIAGGDAGTSNAVAGQSGTISYSSDSKTIMIGKRKTGTQPYKGTIKTAIMFNAASVDTLNNLMAFY